MAIPFIVSDITQKLVQRSVPTLVGWNRLEGRPRQFEMAKALRAEVSDALWMLTRQWQMGEFVGDDAGSPIAANYLTNTTSIDSFESKDVRVPYVKDIPLETRAEMLDFDFFVGNTISALDVRLLMGRQWLKMIAPIGDFKASYLKLYPVEKPDPQSAKAANICAHLAVWQTYAAHAERAIDGFALLQHLLDPVGNPLASDGVEGPTATEKDAIDKAGKRFIAWFRRIYAMPSGEDAWQGSSLDYSFRCMAPGTAGEKTYVSDGYKGGTLDWYSLDVAKAGPKPGADVRVAGAIPTPIAFPGMPDTRWWAFEDGKVNLGLVDVQTTDIGKLLFMEFALVYANDWYVLPLTLPLGSIVEVEGIAVTTVFGERHYVTAAGKGDDADWRRWSMFTNSITGDGHAVADTSLFVPAVLPQVQESTPLEDVLFVRDEMANMVWAVETQVPLATGGSLNGSQAALERRNFMKSFVSTSQTGDHEPKATLRYRVMNSVPDHWIPFIAAKIPGSASEIKLQRASMPFLTEGQTSKPWPIKPRSRVLSEGLHRKPKQPMFIQEEEITRAGLRVIRKYQRTRWRFGRAVIWQGYEKQVGRGEASGNLAFDVLSGTDFRPLEP